MGVRPSCKRQPAKRCASRVAADHYHGGGVRGRRGAGRGLAHFHRCVRFWLSAVTVARAPEPLPSAPATSTPRCTLWRVCLTPLHAAASPGSYIANRVADKISSLADNVYICRSGSVRPLTRLPRDSPSLAAGLLALESAREYSLTPTLLLVLASHTPWRLQAADTQAITSFVRHYIDQHRCVKAFSRLRAQKLLLR